MLLGRERECRRLESLLDDARAGRSRTLVIRGAAGTGKTALVEFAATRGGAFRQVTATGVESESDLPFAALLSISRPLLPFFDSIPTTQRVALEAALALSSGVVADRFTAYAGALTLVAAAADEQPLLVLVDDLQWLDAPSLEALLFVSRRLGPDRVAMVMTARSGEDDAIDLRGLDVVEIEGLDPRSALTLIRRRYRESSFPDSVAGQLIELTAGAPLALIEIPALLAEAQRQGLEPLPDPLPVGDAVQRAFHRQLEVLPESTRTALLLLAGEAHGSMDLVAGALANADIDAAVLEPAEQAGLIRVGEARATFRHPLLRSAVYYGASPADRRAAHHALAAACHRADTERRPWHLAAAAIEPDETVAAALEAAADRSTSRAAFASAARALERAAELTPDTDVRARRLVIAAEAAWRAREPARTQRLLDAASLLARDPVVVADQVLLKGRFLYVQGYAPDANNELVAGALRLIEERPATAAAMLMQASWICAGMAELDQALDSAERAFEVAKGVGGEVEIISVIPLSVALMLKGRGREARSLLGTWIAAVEGHRADPLAIWANPNIGVVCLALGEYEFARSLLQTLHGATRTTPELLPLVLASLSQFEFRTGDWAAAFAHASEGAQLAATTGQTSGTGFVLVNQAIVEAGLGRSDARAHARQVDAMAGRSGFRSLRTYAGSAVGLLDLGAGRLDSAIQELERVDLLMRDWGVGDPDVVQWMPDLVEAYVRAGRRREAGELCETLSTQAEDANSGWARAAAARGEGLLSESFDGAFERALELHAGMPTPFDRARTQLCYGERLRRAGRRVDSREQLRPALETFERLGAADWRKRAAVELGGSVEHRIPRDQAIERLSPQELQVALLVAEGATNRETAAGLFVTTKTVEFHLRNIYAKLGIRSRTELAAVIASRRGPQDADHDGNMTRATALPG